MTVTEVCVRGPGRWRVSPRAWRLCSVLVAFALAMAAGAAGASTVARADALGSATTRAAVLRLQLSDLQSQADRAVERYDLLDGQLGQQVGARVSLEQAVTQADRAARSRGADRDGRVRTLYMRGGQAGLYASVLNSTSLDEALHQTTMVQYVLTGDRAAQGRAVVAMKRLTAAQAAAKHAAELTTRRSLQVVSAADQVRELLRRQQALIATADSLVLALVQQQQDAAAAAAAASFTAQLNAAHAATPPPGSAGLLTASGDRTPLTTAELPGGTALPAGDTAPGAQLATVLAVARQQLGKPYVWGAVGPDSFDCSGFTGYAYAAAGIALPRTAAQQYLTGPHPSLAQLAPGDLLFWATNPADYTSIEHMGMYLGDGLMIVAPHTGDVVKIQRVYADGYFGATRVNPAMSGHVAGPQWADTGRVGSR